MKRTKAQRRWNRKGYTHEMIPLRPFREGNRISYLVGSHESWRTARSQGYMLDMPVRPICKVFFHKGKKPR